MTKKSYLRFSGCHCKPGSWLKRASLLAFADVPDKTFVYIFHSLYFLSSLSKNKLREASKANDKYNSNGG